MAALLSDEEVRARVGMATAPVTEQVTRREIRRYSVATRQRNPRFLAGEEAPPLFYTRFFEDIPSVDGLLPNGQTPDPLTHGLPLKRQMAGGSEVTFHRPIRAGDTLTAVRRLLSIEQKAGAAGPLLLCRIEMAVTNPAGAPVVTEVHTRILR